MASSRPHVHVCTVGAVVYHLHVLPPTAQRVDTWVTIEGARRIGSVPCTADGVLTWPAGLSASFREPVDDALAAARKSWGS